MTGVTCSTCGAQQRQDGRSVQWRTRFRLYAQGTDDPIADSDSERPPDYAGEAVLCGLPAVAEELRGLAEHFHGQPCSGLESVTLQHKLKGLRPTLSRNGGKAVWRVPYKTISGDGAEQLFNARVDIARNIIT